jgi:hypothetical protein
LRALACALFVTPALFAGVARAAPNLPAWSPPVEVVGSAGTDQQEAVAVDGSGDVLVAWARFAGTHETRHIVQFAFRRRGRVFGSPVTISTPHRYADDPAVAFDRFGNAIVVWHQFHHTDSVHAAIRPRGGRFGRPVTLASAGAPRYPAIAFDRAGDAFALWSVDAAGRHGVQLAIRRRGGRFGAPATLSAGKGDADSPRLAVDARGDVVAVWRQCNDDEFQCGDEGNWLIRATYRPAGGPAEAPVALSAPGRDGEDPAVAIGGTGDAVVLWDRFDNELNTVESSRRPADGTFSAVTTLAAPALDPQVAMDSAGDAIAAWLKESGPDLEQAIVQSAVRLAGGNGFGAAQSVTGSENPANLALAMNPRGDAAAVWQHCSSGADSCPRFSIHAATRLPHGTFGTPVTISPPTQDVFFPTLAIDPGGEAVAAWDHIRRQVGAVGLATYRFNA